MMATGHGSEKPSIIFDWFNVSYRALFTTTLALLVVAGAGSYYVYHRVFYLGSPKAEARLAIDQAEEALDRAGPVAQQDGTTGLKESARRLLSESRRQYDAANYEDARKSAVESKLNSEKALALSRGESAREVQFYRIEGDVKVKRVRELIWVDAERGMTLGPGDQVKTSSRASAQIIYFNGTITTVKPGSLLEIKDLYDNPVTRVQQVRERLREGRVTASTQEPVAEGSYHEVATENTVAKSEQRSDFEVAYDKDQESTRVQVLAGKAKLSAGSAPAMELGESERVDVDRRARASSVVKLPPAPALGSPADQKIFLLKDGLEPSIELSWEAADGATAYDLQICSQPLFSAPMVDLVDLKETAATLPNVKEGSYYWRVAAHFENGVTSPFSEPRKFKVVQGSMSLAEDSVPPPLSVDDFLVFASQVIVRGKTEPGAVLTVNGNRVDVADDGTFTTVVALKREGINRVRFLAQDLVGNETRVERVATVDTY